MLKDNKFKVFMAAIILAIVVAIPIAMAQSEGKSGGRGFGGRFERHGGFGGGEGLFFRGLDLTDAQKTQMAQIRESHSANLKALREQIQVVMKDVHQANQGGTFNEALVSQKLAQAAPLQAKLMGEEFKIRQEMLGVLTAEQKAKMEQMREQFKSKRAEGHAKKSATS
jgi:protein CpxP